MADGATVKLQTNRGGDCLVNARANSTIGAGGRTVNYGVEITDCQARNGIEKVGSTLLLYRGDTSSDPSSPTPHQVDGGQNRNGDIPYSHMRTYHSEPQHANDNYRARLEFWVTLKKPSNRRERRNPERWTQASSSQEVHCISSTDYRDRERIFCRMTLDA